MTPSTPDSARGSLRLRIVWPMIALAGLALLLSGFVAATTQHTTTMNAIDDDLARTRDELRVLASEGVDPDTGKAFTGASSLLRTYLARTVITEEAGEVALVEGKVAWVATGDAKVRPENDPQLMEWAIDLGGDDEVVIKSFQSEMGEYRALVAPVHLPESSGALLAVYDLSQAEAQQRQTLTVYALTGLAAIALVALVAWLVAGTILRPVEQLRQAAQAIGERDLTTRVPVTGKDELARLSVTINGMLDRVQRAVEGQRDLLDDVGHELRTPITVVRGHLELVDPHDPQDVIATRDLALDELDRMGGLVNDLLTLAKSSESDFVTPAWTDVALLTDQVVEKASALGNRAWRMDQVAEAEAWLDPVRITQAWLQLAVNAVKYSDEGSPITLGSRLHRGEVELWVADQGIGIAPDELAAVRERFGRARNAPAQVQGAGLGLSIVETIVAAHGGRLEIVSEAGVGSTFTIVVPLGSGSVDAARKDTP